MFPRTRLARTLFLVAATGFALGVSELILCALYPEPTGYFVWPPGLRCTFRPAPGVMPGVEGESRFVVNSLGLRGTEPEPEPAYRILALGGSTTECLYLDQSEAWPQLLEERINAAAPAPTTWVGNGGRSGLDSRDHILQMRHLPPQVRGLNTVLLLVGVNDLTSRLAADWQYDPRALQQAGAEERWLRHTFSVLPPGRGAPVPIWKRTALYRTARAVRDRIFPGATFQDRAGRVYETWREHRQSAPRIRSELPDLGLALQEYARNLETIVRLAEERRVRLVFVTQPVLWRADLPESVEELLWLGGVGDFQRRRGCEYYAVEALAEGMRRYNEVLADVASRFGIECIDLAARIGGDPSLFYDDAHFNEQGARAVADILAQHMLARPPYRPTFGRD